MIFSSEKAREFLLKNGLVYTYRMKQRKQIGDDWMTDKRGGHKITDILVYPGSFVVSEIQLLGYVNQSGFSSLRDWLNEIALLTHADKDNMSLCGWLYKVTLRKEVS